MIVVDAAVVVAALVDAGPLPFEPFARRVWELRETITACDAWYVALAEALDADLATLDRRLAAAGGPRCRFLSAPARTAE